VSFNELELDPEAVPAPAPMPELADVSEVVDPEPAPVPFSLIRSLPLLEQPTNPIMQAARMMYFFIIFLIGIPAVPIWTLREVHFLTEERSVERVKSQSSFSLILPSVRCRLSAKG
jgi:hypothetical protein